MLYFLKAVVISKFTHSEYFCSNKYSNSATFVVDRGGFSWFVSCYSSIGDSIFSMLLYFLSMMLDRNYGQVGVVLVLAITPSIDSNANVQCRRCINLKSDSAFKVFVYLVQSHTSLVIVLCRENKVDDTHN